MNPSSHDLLAALGAVVRPEGAPAPAPRRAAIEDLDFQSFLAKATAGELTSGRRVAPARGVDVELAEESIERLSRAADEAESLGAARLFALLGESGYEIDVPTRTIRRAAPASELGRVQTGIDALIVQTGDGALGGADAESVAQHVLSRRPPTASPPGRSVAAALQSARDATLIGGRTSEARH